jgi:hypothetical protein
MQAALLAYFCLLFHRDNSGVAYRSYSVLFLRVDVVKQQTVELSEHSPIHQRVF